ncbi:CDP-diacylglycerol--serine O-phosphatidyltransferase [bacterium]|nr:CDP-diacylglycerol--serine O-phosphatidyltransferase [bacterium]
MKKGVRTFLPGFFTVGNMAFGFFSILSSFQGQGINAAWMIILAAFFDFLDGRIARATHSTTEFGVQLDSFADLVSFGVAPATLLYSQNIYPFGNWGNLIGLIFIASGAFRLARFNLVAELERKTRFIGLPIPMAAVSIASYILFSMQLAGVILFPKFLVGLLLILSWLMVSTVRYESIPHLSLREGKGKLELLLMIIAGGLILYDPQFFMFPLIIMYILSGLVREIVLILRGEYKDKKIPQEETI